MKYTITIKFYSDRNSYYITKNCDLADDLCDTALFDSKEEAKEIADEFKKECACPEDIYRIAIDTLED